MNSNNAVEGDSEYLHTEVTQDMLITIINHSLEAYNVNHAIRPEELYHILNP